jgi:hypothetical protein
MVASPPPDVCFFLSLPLMTDISHFLFLLQISRLPLLFDFFTPKRVMADSRLLLLDR